MFASSFVLSFHDNGEILGRVYLFDRVCHRACLCLYHLIPSHCVYSIYSGCERAGRVSCQHINTTCYSFKTFTYLLKEFYPVYFKSNCNYLLIYCTADNIPC